MPLLCLAALAIGCGEKETPAPQPVGDLKAYPGRNAAKVEFSVASDVRSGKIFYASGSFDEFTVSDPGAVQSVVVRGLPEGENIIRVVTMNADSVYSDPRGVKVLVYGDSYLKKLSNRVLKDQKFISASSIELMFGEALADETELRVFFTTTSGVQDSVLLSTGQTTIGLNDIDLGKDYRYCSVFKPTADFIDEYVTEKVSIPDLNKKKFWKNIWRIKAVSSEDSQMKAANLIDNQVNSVWRSQGVSGPHWIVVDMQGPKLYDGFIVVQAQELKNGGGFSRRYVFESSDDGSAWNMVQDGRLRAHGYRQKIVFKHSVTSRYFRITVQDSYDDAIPQLAELDLFNDTGTSGQNGLNIPMLVNAKPPFQGDGSDRFPAVGAGRMQRLTGWTHNAAANISYDKATGFFSIFSAAVWGCPSVTNGKIYQSLDLLPGKYVLKVDVGNTTNPACTDAFGIITKADTLPDFQNVETDRDVVGSADLDAHAQSMVTIPFALGSPSKVAIGIVYNTYNIYPTTIWSDLSFKSFVVESE